MNSNIYDINYKLLWETLLPPILRKNRLKQWGDVLTKPIQSLHNFIFYEYANGANYPYWDPTFNYVAGDQVVYTFRRVYTCIAANINQQPDLSVSSTYWVMTNPNYVGIREKIKYNSQKILFEYALNKWFQSSGIFINNNAIDGSRFLMANSSGLSSTMAKTSTYSTDYLGSTYTAPSQYAFTIFVPIAVYNALSPNASQRESIIRSFADLYVLGGMMYDVQTY